MNHFGIKVRSIRKKHSYTQLEFAKLLGYKSKSSIAKIESGVNEMSHQKFTRLITLFPSERDFLIGSSYNNNIQNASFSNSVLFLNFSARDEGISSEVINHLFNKGDTIINFSSLKINPCQGCHYECFHDKCLYSEDELSKLYEIMMSYYKIVFVIPIYCGNPSSLFFAFNERSQDFFMHHEDSYTHLIKKSFFVGIIGSLKEAPNFTLPFLDWVSNPSKQIYTIERHVLKLKMENLLSDNKEGQEVLLKIKEALVHLPIASR